MATKSTLEWLKYYVDKAREEGFEVSARVDRLSEDGVSEGKTL